MHHDLTLTEQLLRPLLPPGTPRWQNGWEVGRLVLAQAYRCGQDLLKRCLFLTLHYLCQNAEVDNLTWIVFPCFKQAVPTFRFYRF